MLFVLCRAISEAEKDAMRHKLIADFDEPVPQVISLHSVCPVYFLSWHFLLGIKIQYLLEEHMTNFLSFFV